MILLFAAFIAALFLGLVALVWWLTEDSIEECKRRHPCNGERP